MTRQHADSFTQLPPDVTITSDIKYEARDLTNESLLPTTPIRPPIHWLLLFYSISILFFLYFIFIFSFSVEQIQKKKMPKHSVYLSKFILAHSPEYSLHQRPNVFSVSKHFHESLSPHTKPLIVQLNSSQLRGKPVVDWSLWDLDILLNSHNLVAIINSYCLIVPDSDAVTSTTNCTLCTGIKKES